MTNSGQCAFPAWIFFKMRFGGDKRPIFLDGIIRGTPVTAQVGETLYYLSAGFLTFNQIDFTSCLSADG
jgi:hypothetical protein